MWHGGAGLGGGVRAPAIKTQEPTMRQRHCLATRISKACRRPHGGGIGWVSTPMVMRTFGLSERQLGLTLSVSKRRSTSSRRYDIDGRPSRRPCPQSCRHWSRPGKAGLGTAALPADAPAGHGGPTRGRGSVGGRLGKEGPMALPATTAASVAGRTRRPDLLLLPSQARDGSVERVDAHGYSRRQRLARGRE
ncbi:hypothetical protein PVAP13_6KG369706 [Panicum virgatum]|uniref:Uncharacterized protein n=1 Tax=Panicum virgatum TaxID=38727 RepID=A0A8T0RI75_PANVG|nr:hypothetical protein PVAP13_6KG369706 [Panicum virgatum]